MRGTRCGEVHCPHYTQADPAMTDAELHALAGQIKDWAAELGFQACGITSPEPGEHATRLREWLGQGHHAGMAWMEEHAPLRENPALLLPGTQRVISLRLDYLNTAGNPLAALDEPERASIARYALGRDYHRLMRKRLDRLAERIRSAAPEAGTRACIDSAPVLERAFAEKAGLGWIGKNTMLISPEAGSWFFLGEILTTLPLPLDAPFGRQHCGTCTACLDICPTQAFTAPWQLDARRCISYLTIEHEGSIPPELRAPIGNRIFGCDDCLATCPWNRFARLTQEGDFQPRHGLDTAQLVELFRWDEATFLQKTEGSPLRRTGYEHWLRNLAVALGNAPRSPLVTQALQERLADATPLLREHIEWALAQQAA